MFVAPVVGAIPNAATAPALIIVGSLMIAHAAEIPWSNLVLSIPAFLIIVTIPLTFSIANGLAFGFTAYTVLKIAARRVSQRKLAGLRADDPVYRTVRLPGFELERKAHLQFQPPVVGIFGEALAIDVAGGLIRLAEKR